MPTHPSPQPGQPLKELKLPTTSDYKQKSKNKNKKKPKAAPIIRERATDESVYTTGSWGQKASDQEFDVVTPSGQRCRVKKMSVEDLVFNGAIDDLDAISQLVETVHLQPRRGKGQPQKTKEQLATEEARNGLKLLGDPNMKKAFSMVDMIVCKTVVAPVVHLRDNSVPTIPGAIYVDMIDIEDRFFIFSQVMGGMENAATFRQESSEALGAVQPL